MNDEMEELGDALNKHGYEYEGFLGDGKYGYVCQVSKRSGSSVQKYAIKFLDTTKRDKFDPQKYNQREVKLLKRLDTYEQNIVQYYENWNMTVGGKQFLCIEMELCWRELFTFVYNNDMGGAEIVKAPGKPRLYQQVFPQILEGLKAIHSIGWVHRDIHYQNILVATPKPSKISEIKIKIADFGLARKIESTSQSDESTMARLSPFSQLGLFSAPELSTRKYDKKVDLYSAGIVLYFLSCYEPDKKKWEVEIEKLKNQGPFYDHLCFKEDDKLLNLIMLLTCKNPKNRPTAEEALNLMKTSFPDSKNFSSTGTSFLVKKYGDRYWKRGTSKNDTLSSLKDEIYSCTRVEPKLQALFQETEITVSGNNAPQPVPVEINDDNQVEKMFLSARENKKRVCIVVEENMDISA